MTNRLLIILFILGFLILSLISKKSDFLLLALDWLMLLSESGLSSYVLLDRKFIRLPLVYFESKFKMTGVISYNLALIIEFCLIKADFLSLLLIGILYDWGGVEFLTVLICWWVIFGRCMLTALLLISFYLKLLAFETDLSKLLLESDKLEIFGFWLE